MTLLDVLWLVIIGVSAAISLWRGFVKEVFSLAAWVLAVVVAARLGSPLARALGESIADPQVRAVTAFLLLFFLTLLAASLVGVFAYRLVHSAGLKPTDRTLGLFFGLLRGVVVVGVVVLVVRGTPLGESPVYEQAYLRPGLDPVADFLHRLLPAEYGAYFDAGMLPLEELQERARDVGKDALDREGLERVIENSLESGE
ncbi:CvpA family protein [Thiohalorhabdus denitrificans]|uniref:Membrane protein required for colicin V production n=1 Tax=Thiohalorhabdus denitrificans TaxID=381306 RepID=A0A1G5HAV9_9GAMM|nr:CvpA family protein [Thiohalorhabdus denitrificans]SCY60903.1 membrane protein required for colicin V production [Thiohalorhabdus denitrificans]